MSLSRPWRPLRLRTKLVLLFEGAVVLVGATTGALASLRTRSTVEAELVKRGLAIATDLATFSVRPLLDDDLAALRRMVNHAVTQDYVRTVAILDTDGRVVMHSDLARIGERASATSPAGGGCGATLATADEPRYEIACPIVAAEERLGSVVVGYSRAAADLALAQVRRDIAWACLVVSLFGGGLAFLLSSYVSRPITQIAAAMQRARAGAIAPLLDERRSDEIGLLAASFNQMTTDLARHEQHLSELVEARTAELRESNTRLEREVAERTEVEAELRRSRQELRDLTAHLQSVREQERTEVAREIHDELGQDLTVLKMDVHWVAQRVGPTPPVAARLATMSRAIDGTVQAVRRLSSRLRPKLLDDLGLSAAIEWQAREFEQHAGVACRVRSDPDDILLDPARSTALFRIFQETLTNVARHAGASRVDVVLQRLPDRVELQVEDDGNGITSERVADRRSLGIVGMRERVRPLGGHLDIVGRPGGGTTVRVSIPC